MVIEGGQIGFDEGGVLQALSKPFMQRETISYEYNRKGLVTAQHTDRYDVSMAHVLAAAVLVLGPAVLLKFNNEVFTNPEVQDVVKNAFAPDLDPLKRVILPDLSTETKAGIEAVIRKYLDPFNFFK